MPFYRTLRFFFFFLLCSGFAFAQDYPGKNYTAADKLPNNAVRSLLVDSNNVLWIGTENGVVKKENDEFKYFFEEDGLALNSCWAIAEDQNHKLWFGSYGEGLSVYDGFSFRVISKKDGLVHNEITHLFSYRDKMYVGTSDGVSVIDVDSFKVLSSNVFSEEKLLRVQGFFEYKDEIYAAAYNNSGVYKIVIEDDNLNLLKVRDPGSTYSIFVDNDSIYSSKKGFFTRNSLADYVDEKAAVSSEELGYSIIWDYIKTNDNRIFAGAWGIYDTNGGIYEIVNNKMISRASEFNIQSKNVLSLAYDPKFEILYAGTKDEGLYEVSLNPEIKFHEIKGKVVLGFAQTEHTSAVLLNDGIFLKGLKKEHKISLSQLKNWEENYVLNTRIPLPEHEDNFYELDYTTKAEEIGFYDIKAYKNSYWINTNIGIFAIKESGELLRYLPVHSEEINFTPAGDLIETNPYGGVRIYKDLDAFEYTYYDPTDPKVPTMVVGSLQREDKTYFLSIFTGLYVYENNKFRSYLKDGIWKEKKLKHITPLENNLAISNEFGDVFIVNDEPSFKILKKIPRAKIEGNSIVFLKQYRGHLLIGTEKGLTIYKDGRFIFVDKEQGLEQPILSAKVHKDELSVGSKNGLYLIDLKALTDTKALVDKLKIKEILVNNEKYPFRAGGATPDLNLNYDENTLSLRFTTNAHPYPHKLEYQYKLNPREDWSLPSSQPQIFLPYLSAGDYEVDVKILDASTGLKSVQPLINFSIFPPFWKTWWFILLMTLLLLTSTYGVYRFQINQTQKFEEQKRTIQKRFEETKMEALLAQMNPHFIFNAMNSIQYYIMENDIDNASIFLGDFARLIRLNLDHCNKPKILLSEEIDYLESYMRVENTRFNNKINVIVEVDPVINPYEIEIPTMLLQTFIENVFVHAFPDEVRDPTLKISFRLLSKRALQCIIKDNGVGISNSSTNKLHQSKGVSLVKERLALLGYDTEEAIEIISQKNLGTTVVLNLQI